MSSKTLIQSGIILIIGLILFLIYKYFFDVNKEFKKMGEAKIEKNIDNKIIDLKYNAIDEDGNRYIIESDAGKVSEEDKNILILEKVMGVIKIENSADIIILSNFANYNKVTFDTLFYGDVKLTNEGHSIKSETMFMNYIEKNINIEKINIIFF